MCKSKFKRGLVSVVALGMSIVMFSGCEKTSEPVFNPNGGNINNSSNEAPAKSEAVVETTTVNKYLQEAIENSRKTNEALEKRGITFDPNKRLGKDSNGNYVEKKCVNPYCGCAVCKCTPTCECDDR